MGSAQASAAARVPLAETGQFPRRCAWVLLLSLCLASALYVVAVTPWSPWPGGGTLHPHPLRDFSARQIARSTTFAAQLRPPAYAALAVGLLASVLLGLTPSGSALVRRVGRRLRPWPLQVMAGVAAVGLITALARLPLDIWAETVLLRFGLSTQSWTSWALDVFRGWAVATAMSAIAVLPLVWLARRLPRWWFLPAAAGAAGLVLAGSFVYPVVVEPLFNHFRPMADTALRTSLLRLASRDGVAVDDVLVADASRRTTTLNAYVSGFGSTRRIVVYDTLLRQASPAQVRLVVAHELGHAKAQDVLLGSALGALGAAAGVVALGLLLDNGRLLRRSGASGPGDPTVVPLVMALAAVAGFLALPVGNAMSRQIEARADVHALNLTSDPSTFIAMQRRLALANLTNLDPPKLTYWWFATHPTPPERIAIARRWARQQP